MKNILIYISLLAFLSCEKNAEPAPVVVPTGTFMFHLHTYIDNDEVDLYNIDYATLDGRTVSLSLAQLYVSDIQLVRADGSTYDIKGKSLLKVLEKDTYVAGEVPVGSYKSLRFKVGLDAATNGLAPAATPEPAIFDKSEMWFGNSAQPDGYVFMNVQGKVDTSADFSHPPVPFVYKIGTNAHYKQVNMGDHNFTIVEGQVELGHIIIDYNRLFNGIQLNNKDNLSITSASANSTALAAKIANNIPSMFIYE